MNRSVIRYLNLRLLIETKAGDSISAFADLVNKQRETLARVGTKKRFNPDVTIGERLAEDIEAALGLGAMWMDTFHSFPKHLPPELASLRKEFESSHPLPVLDWATAGRILNEDLTTIPADSASLLASTTNQRGFFLQVDVDEYMPHVLPGMLLEIDRDRQPTQQEADQKTTLVLVRHPDHYLFMIRRVSVIDNKMLYVPVSAHDPFQNTEPSDWSYGGLVVMRLMP